MYCFTSYLAGPAFGIKEYLQVCNGTKFQKGEEVPSRFPTALWVFLQSVVMVALMVVGGAKFPMSLAFDKEWLASTAYAGPVGWLKNIGAVWLALFFVRCKYYFGWLLSEGSSIVSGFGYSAKTKSWRSAANVDWFGFETAQSVRAGSRAWNQRTQQWLEECVYHRTGGSLFATYFVSAFWHGFYPGYYLFFLSVPLATSINRLAFKKCRPRFMKDDGKTPKGSKIFYDILSWLSTSLIMNYLAAVFQVSLRRRLLASHPSVPSRVLPAGPVLGERCHHVVILLLRRPRGHGCGVHLAGVHRAQRQEEAGVSCAQQVLVNQSSTNHQTRKRSIGTHKLQQHCPCTTVAREPCVVTLSQSGAGDALVPGVTYWNGTAVCWGWDPPRPLCTAHCNSKWALPAALPVFKSATSWCVPVAGHDYARLTSPVTHLVRWGLFRCRHHHCEAHR